MPPSKTFSMLGMVLSARCITLGKVAPQPFWLKIKLAVSRCGGWASLSLGWRFRSGAVGWDPSQ